MTEADVEAAIGEHVRAFNERDVDALMNGFTDDASWITGTSAVRGRAELTELFTSAMAGLLPTLTIQNLLATPDRAACQLTERLTVHGEEQVCSIAGFYEFRDGRIAAAKIYREGNAEVELPRPAALVVQPQDQRRDVPRVIFTTVMPAVKRHPLHLERGGHPRPPTQPAGLRENGLGVAVHWPEWVADIDALPLKLMPVVVAPARPRPAA